MNTLLLKEDYLRILKIIPEPIVITDTSPIIIYVNPAFEKLTGYKLPEVKGKNPRILKSDKTPLKVYQKIYRALTGCKSFTTKKMVNRRKDGSLYQVNASYFPVCAEGKPVFYVQIQHDISEHKKTEEELTKHAIQLEKLSRSLQETLVKEKALLESIGDGVVAIDKKSKIIALNKKTETIFGWKSQEMLGKPFFSQFKLKDENGKIIPKKLHPPQLALTTGQVINGIYYLNKYLNKENASQLPLLITSSPVILNNEVIGTITIYHDVSQQVAIDRAKDEFVSITSHELRTPLSTISWSLERLREEDNTYSASQKKNLDQISRQTRNMIRLINDLLVATRMELGVYSYKYEEVNPLDIAKNVIEDLIDEMENKKIKFSSLLDKKIRAYKTYSNALHIILENLLSNAVKYTPTGGKVSLRMSEIGNTLVMRISDSGFGIPKSAREKIFQKGYRTNNVKGKFEGSGLGLYITKTMVDHMEGSISIKSKRNKGVTFTVTLPVLEEIIQKNERVLYNKLPEQISL